MRKITIFFLVILFVFIIIFYVNVNKKNNNDTEDSLRILWAEWAPAGYLQQLSKGFTEKTGIKVIVHQVPWSTFHSVFFESVKNKSDDYDMVCGDSQWLGVAATEEFYVNLSYFFNLHNIDEIMTEASVRGYSEYPRDSGKYWSVPLQGDAMGFAYRRDLFEKPEEKKNFRLKYGYELNVPDTWEQLIDIAEFFYRPEKDLYGVTIWDDKSYDAMTMGIDSFIWAWGAELGNEKTYKVKGLLNTLKAQEALRAYKRLYSTSILKKDLDANKVFYSGKAAMIMTYYAFFSDMLDYRINPYAQNTAFFINPKGPNKRVTSLGGQGLSVVSYTKKKTEAFKFLEWFIKKETQEKWADLGGFTCHKEVLNSEEFLSKSLYNQQLAESFEFMRDFWVVPQYRELIASSQKYFYGYVVEDKYTAKEALDNIAESWENIFEMAGYYKE